MKRTLARLALVAAIPLASSCGEPLTSPTPVPESSADFKAAAPRGLAGGATSPDFSRLTAFVEGVNARLETAGSEIRLEYPWLFRVGPGTDPFGQLRTGTRWPMMEVGYILDESDYTGQLAAGVVDAVLERAYDTWNAIPNSHLVATRNPDPGGNPDVLDGIVRNAAGECIDVIDFGSDILDLSTGELNPVDDIVVGGWLEAAYFEDCLGSADIVGVTWFFSGPDANGDGYRDQLYVEQFYNEAFAWVNSGASFLNFSIVDLESIALHENGHTHGLGHFGGPIRNQPFQLQPNGKVFNPEAVMNPIYLGGEERVLLPTDVAGMRTLYAR